MDHLEALRWHIMRMVFVWGTCAILIFIFKDWVYDNVITAPSKADFITYGSLCRLGNWLHLGNSLCMPPVKIDYQITEINGTFTSAIDIAIIGGVIVAFPYIFWELWRFYKACTFCKRKKICKGQYWLGIAVFFYRRCFWLLFTGAIHF